MKKIHLILSVISFIFLISCINDSDHFNDDRDKPYELPTALYLTRAQRELAKQMATPNVNQNVFRFFQHYWTTTTYSTDARFNFSNRKVPDNHWDALYIGVLGNLESAKQAIPSDVKPASVKQEDWEKQQANKLAILDILQVYAFHILVDSFGDIPYSESLNPKLILPKYDDDAGIYPDLLKRLDQDLSQLDVSYKSFETGDYLLNGNVVKWKIFANSLKLKIAINLSDVNPGLAKSAIESAYNGGVVLDNSEDIKFNFPETSPNYNPIYAETIANGNYFVVEETIVNTMNQLSDPRRAVYFTPIDGTYIGGILGLQNSYSKFSHVGNDLLSPTLPAYLFDSSEINFYLAEAAVRGYSVGQTPGYYYNKAISESFKQWGLSDAEASAYISTVPFSSGAWKERIGEQAWIALFNRGFESWNFWRRLDYPVLTAPYAVDAADKKVPLRLTYPINEQTVNGANWMKASQAIGGDKLTTRVFWDIN